jgi:hypothetical protein
VPLGVLEQVAHHAPQPVGVPDDAHGLHGHRHRHPARPEDARLGEDDVVEVDVAHGQGHRVLVGRGEREEVVDEHRQAVDLGRGPVGREPSLVRGPVLGEPVEQHPDRGEGTAQLVTGIRDERPPGGVGTAQPVEHPVEGLGEAGQLVAARRHLEGGSRPRRRDRLHLVAHAVHGSQRLPHGEGRDRPQHRDEAEGADERELERPAEGGTPDACRRRDDHRVGLVVLAPRRGRGNGVRPSLDAGEVAHDDDLRPAWLDVEVGERAVGRRVGGDHDGPVRVDDLRDPARDVVVVGGGELHDVVTGDLGAQLGHLGQGDLARRHLEDLAQRDVDDPGDRGTDQEGDRHRQREDAAPQAEPGSHAESLGMPFGDPR